VQEIVIAFTGNNVLAICFSSSRDSAITLSHSVYIELASEADQQFALQLHQKLYCGRCITGLSFIHSFICNSCVWTDKEMHKNDNKSMLEL